LIASAPSVIMKIMMIKKSTRKAKSELILVAAHQLKTPLSALKWIFKMFLEGEAGKTTSEQTELLKKGDEATEGMITMINDILNAERMAKKKIVYDFKKNNFSEIAKEAISSFSGPAAKKNIGVELNFPTEDIYLVCDGPTIKIALENIIGNAVHYSPENGKITINVSKKNGSVEFSVKDNGIGIPLNQQKKIFCKFFRADNALKSQKTGSGLGLYMVKNIVKEHRGKIWFESEENKGSKFYISLGTSRAAK